MEKGKVFLIFLGFVVLCFLVYNSITNVYTKLVGGFINRSPVRFECKKSSLHAVAYGGTGTGKTYFVKKDLKLYQDQDQDQGSCFIDPDQDQGTCFPDAD